MIRVNLNKFALVFTGLLLIFTVMLYGCSDAVSTSSDKLSDECVVSGVVIPSDALSSLAPSQGMSLKGCEVWSESEFSRRVTADSDGNYHLIAAPGNIRITARLINTDGVFVGRSRVISALKGYRENRADPFEIKKAERSLAFRLKDTAGNPLTSSAVLNASVWGMPAYYDSARGCYLSPLLPADGEAEVNVYGGSYRKNSFTSDLKNAPDEFEYTVLRNSDSGSAPKIISMCSSNGAPVDSQFISNGVHDLDLTARFEDLDGDIATWSWNDGGLGSFVYQGGDSSLTYSRVIWRPYSADGVGTITFKVYDRKNYSAGASIGVNKNVQGSVVPDRNKVRIAFGPLNENVDGIIYNPTSLSINSNESSFRVKINITGVSDAGFLKGGSAKTAVSFEGIPLADNGDETAGNILTNRVYSLKRPIYAGTYPIKVTVEDNKGYRHTDEYRLNVTAGLVHSEIKMEPERTVFEQGEQLTFSMWAEADSPDEAITFKWYVDGTESFKDILSNNSARKESVFETTAGNPGSHVVKCLIQGKTGSSIESSINYSVSESIVMEFLKDTNNPPCFNPTWLDTYEYNGAPEFKVMVYNRKAGSIKPVWEICNKSQEETAWSYITNESSVKNMGKGCVVSINMNGYGMLETATYSLRLTVKDENNQVSSAVLDDIYVDFKPIVEQVVLLDNEYYELDRDEYGFYHVGYGSGDNGLVPNIKITDLDLNDSISVSWDVVLYDSYDDWEYDTMFNIDTGNHSWSAVTEIKNRTEQTVVASCTIPIEAYENMSYYGLAVVNYEVKDMMYGRPEHATKGTVLFGIN